MNLIGNSGSGNWQLVGIGDRRPDNAGQSPVQQNYFAEIPKDDILPFQITVQHASGMSIPVARQTPRGKLSNSFMQRLALHKPHRIKRTVQFFRIHFVNRHDAWVLKHSSMAATAL